MDLRARIQALSPTIVKILAASGSPALSLGVLHQDQILHTEHFGRRHASDPTPPDDNTLYHVASLTKALTAAAVASLVEDGTVSWDTPIRDYLPGFRRRKDELGMRCTLRDLLSNRTGLPVATALWGQQSGEFLLPRHEMIRMASYLEAV